MKYQAILGNVFSAFQAYVSVEADSKAEARLLVAAALVPNRAYEKLVCIDLTDKVRIDFQAWPQNIYANDFTLVEKENE